MNLERIAEIEARGSVLGEAEDPAELYEATLLELCRLARLGLRVESAPIGVAYGGLNSTGYMKTENYIVVDVPREWEGKCVALVVEESK